jgi:hypothetical protein
VLPAKSSALSLPSLGALLQTRALEDCTSAFALKTPNWVSRPKGGAKGIRKSARTIDGMLKRQRLHADYLNEGAPLPARIENRP